MSESNIALVRRWFEEVWNQRRQETITELLCAESTCYGDDVSLRGPDEFRQQQFEPLTQAFPDLQSSIEGIIADGDVVVVRWLGVGHHTGMGLGFPPTGEQVELRGMTWIEIRDGKFYQGWQRSNIREVLDGLARRANAHSGAPVTAAAPF